MRDRLMHSLADQVKGIKDAMRARIFRGELTQGQRIDKNTVREEYKASVRAVHVALTGLAREGLLTRTPHVGTYVSSDLPTAVMTVLPRLHAVGLLSALS